MAGISLNIPGNKQQSLEKEEKESREKRLHIKLPVKRLSTQVH